jgi:hypothetical protein
MFSRHTGADFSIAHAEKCIVLIHIVAEYVETALCLLNISLNMLKINCVINIDAKQIKKHALCLLTLFSNC